MVGQYMYVVQLDRRDQSAESGVGPLGTTQEETTDIVGDMQESIYIGLLNIPFTVFVAHWVLSPHVAG